jgi:RHS repeat-associated protein
MKDIKAADPGANINLVETPQVNSKGDAHVNYPIEIPPGRNGMQPALAFSYNSSGSNGWIGLGWDLAVPAITIDTRWGVPRYWDDVETETYLLNGQQLTPVVHRSELEQRTAEKVFYTRVEGAFQQITRHGDHPNNYWWEVADKLGTRYFYGGDLTTNGPVNEAVLTDYEGNIFRWGLRQVLDLDGNTIDYTYVVVCHTGFGDCSDTPEKQPVTAIHRTYLPIIAYNSDFSEPVLNSVPGYQLYPKTINYTGFNGSPGAYIITFVRDRELPDFDPRTDVMIDARGGFKMVTADLLQQIQVSFNGDLIRQYNLEYQEGAFHKNLLVSIKQLGENGEFFNEHSFTYYDEIRDSNGDYLGFAPKEDWDTGEDDVSIALLGHGHAAALGGIVNDSFGSHAYIGFNPLKSSKSGSAGGKIGFNYAVSEGVLTLIDINGDSLPDKVYQKDDGVYFRLNQAGPNGNTTFSEPYSITLPTISRERSIMVSYGHEWYLGANLFLNGSHTFTYGHTYFSDVNGDGLPDLVIDGQVLFNYLDHNGIPTFVPNSNYSPVPIGPGTVNTSDLIGDYEDVYQEMIDNLPLHDTLRRWIVPYNGIIRINGPVALIEDTSSDREDYVTADGVRVTIQHNGAELWQTIIDPDDYTPKDPTSVDSVNVQAGDRIYFRVQSIFDGAYDQVAWNPTISYLDVPLQLTDANGLDPYKYQASEDFVMGGRPGIHVSAPVTGTLRLTGILQKLGVTTDDITLVASRNGTALFQHTLLWDETGDIVIEEEFDVLYQDVIQLRIKVDSPIDLSLIRFVPHLFYIDAEVPGTIIDEDGQYLYQLHPPYDIDLFPANDLDEPQDFWEVPQTGLTLVIPLLEALTSDASGEVYFTVKRVGERVAKHEIVIIDGEVDASPFFMLVSQGDRLFFDFSVYDPELAAELDQSVRLSYVGGNTFTVPSALHHSVAAHTVWPQPYRGWGFAGYNGNRERALEPLDEVELAREFDADSEYDPRTAKAYFFLPVPEQNIWIGPDTLTWISQNKMSSSRLGEYDYIEIPRPGDFAGGRAVNRVGYARQITTGGGVGPFSGSVTIAGRSHSELDFLDMNGDGFPDIVGNGHIQYSTLMGGLEEEAQSLSGYERPRASSSSARNFGIGGSPAQFGVGSRGTSNNSGSQMVSLGLSGNLGDGKSDVQYDLIDINGDGLPDRVYQRGSELLVAFNLGYKFAPAEVWDYARLSDGSSNSQSIGVTLGYNGDSFNFAGGASLSKSESDIKESLIDINGNGLPDRVTPNGSSLAVSLNTGNGFATPIDWHGAITENLFTSEKASLGGGLYFTVGIGPICWFGCYLIVNPGADYNRSMNRQQVTLRDVNGDGFADHIISTEDSSMGVALNLTGRTNLLHTIQRPLGSIVTLEYARDGNTYDMPQSRWVLSAITQYDGHPGDGADIQLTTYQYSDGFYNRLEREFYGYGTVIQEQRDTANNNALYRATIRQFHNDSYYNKGLLHLERIEDAQGNPYLETEYTYRLVDVDTGDVINDDQSTTATVFPQLIRIDHRYFEGNTVPGKTTFTTQAYDEWGNIVSIFVAGEEGSDDDLTATLVYSDCPNTYVMGIPITIEVLGNGTTMRYREATVDCLSGHLTQVRAFLSDDSVAVTDLAYFDNGNLQRVIGPENHLGQRYEIFYEYDPVVQTYVTSITDSFGYVSTAEHNYKYGATLVTTDINNNATSYAYDPFGRMISITGPFEQGGSTPTIQFEYHAEAAVPWALTRHLDSYRDSDDTIDTVLFIDGLKRVIQVKKDGTIHTDPDADPIDVMIVSGRVTFDSLGRTVESYYPVTEPLGTYGMFNDSYDAVQPTRLDHDVLDRVVNMTIPDNTSTTMAYGFGPDRNGMLQFEVVVTDANNVQKVTYRDVRKQITGVKEFNTLPDGTVQEIWTSYGYDPLLQITSVLDDHNNITAVVYDNFGRRAAIDNPDTGRTEMIYDLAGNQIAKITANLAAAEVQINYEYDFGRLSRILYPSFPDNNVTYSYGEPGAPYNRAGRITHVTDESGEEERFYGLLGEVVKEIKSVASDTGPVLEVYTTEYEYDTWGRLQVLTFPDGEVLTYSYDAGGQPNQVVGTKAGYTYAYINRMEYDKFEQRVFVEAANGVRTRYQYHPLNRRLVNLQAGAEENDLFQNLNYTYDSVGNILGLQNDVPIAPPPNYGGPTNQTFVYDDLYRLVGATGVYQYAPNKSDEYSLQMSYDTIHNLQRKNQLHELVQPSGQRIRQHATSYDWTYEYTGSQPHAPTHIGNRTFSYDANGNQSGWEHDQNGTNRTIIWDEENRIQSIFNNGQEITYKYNHAGERIIKRGPQGETVYVNQYFSIRNREIGTKHIFVGTTRLVSKLMKQPRPERALFWLPGPYEKDQYFFHADHLGSTNYVTDKDGEIYQHLEYFAFGETWVEESSNTQRTPYLFTAKELDEETGLYYFGARYYDPRTNVWLSTDPLLTSRLDSDSLFNMKNLSLYAYSHHNPLRYIDPDGRDPIAAQASRKGSITDVDIGDVFRASGDFLFGASKIAVGLYIIGQTGGAAGLPAFLVAEVGFIDTVIASANITRSLKGEKLLPFNSFIGMLTKGTAEGLGADEKRAEVIGGIAALIAEGRISKKSLETLLRQPFFKGSAAHQLLRELDGLGKAGTVVRGADSFVAPKQDEIKGNVDVPFDEGGQVDPATNQVRPAAGTTDVRSE